MSFRISVSQPAFWLRRAQAQVRAACRAAVKRGVGLVFVGAVACSGNIQTVPGQASAGAGAASRGDSGGAATAQGGAGAGSDGGAGDASPGGNPNAVLTELAFVPAEVTLVVGGQLQLLVVGTYSTGVKQDLTSVALFYSSEPNVATVRGQVVYAQATGQATVTASVAALSANATITVAAQRVTAITIATSKPTMAVDDGTPLHALASMADGSTRDVTASAVWSSSDAKVARLYMPQNGFLVAMGRGTATITATLGDVTGSLQETVTGDTLISYSIHGTRVLRLGDETTFQLRALYDSRRDANESDATWQSSDAGVLTVSATGSIKAVAHGHATISALLGPNVVASADVTVPNAVLQSIQLVGQTAYEFCNPPFLQAIGTYSDGSNLDVTYLLDGGAFGAGATVDNFGTDEMRIAPSALGTTEIDVSVGDVQGSAMFTAVFGSPAGIQVSDTLTFPVSASAVLGAWAQCPDQASSFEVTNLVKWQSDDPKVVGVAPVIDSIEAFGVGVGTTNIHASYPGFAIAPISVTVFDASPVTLELDPDTANLDSTAWFPMQAYGRYADDSRYLLTEVCTWTTSNTRVAKISNAKGSVGKLTGVAVGPVKVTAKFGALTATASLEMY